MLLVLPYLEKKMSKRNVMFLSVIIYIAGDLIIYLGKTSAVCLIIGLAVTGLGIYGIFGTTFAIQPDVIDYSEYRKNKSVSGLIAAFQGFFVKASMGLASAVIGLLLKQGGYVANAAQTPKALAYIEASFIWIPMVLCVVIGVVMCFYRLDKERGNMDEELERRRRSLNAG